MSRKHKQDVSNTLAKTIKRNKSASILFIAISFLIFSIAIPKIQNIIDSRKEVLYKYIVNLQISSANKSQFLNHADIIFYLDKFKYNIIKSIDNTNDYKEIVKLLESRRNQYLADYLFGIIADPGLPRNESSSFHKKLRDSSINELLRIESELLNSTNFKVWEVHIKTIDKIETYKNITYGIGTFFFLLGTIFQILTVKNE